MQLPGIGTTTATVLVAMIGNGHEFKCGRQFAAWLGLTPGQYSSGGKTRLGRITKAGDGYLRSLLIEWVARAASFIRVRSADALYLMTVCSLSVRNPAR
jgi:transposase